jgi:ubiquitin-like 1-activating enzyme E1 B
MSDLGLLIEKEPLDVLTQLFQKDIDVIKESKEDSEKKALAESYLKRIRSLPTELLEKQCGEKVLAGFTGFDRVLTLEESVSVFAEAFAKLKEEKRKLGSVVFEKDDDEVIHFVSAAANLRMHCFTIEQQSFNEIKNMAGNIVPAIASTNSIVSGLQVV